jgi:protocatechuate 3,4-dioxygenase beta subunit
MAPAQSVPAKPTPTEGATDTKAAELPGRVMGTIYCSDTHKPARGAEVMLGQTTGRVRQSGLRSWTDTDGKYVFSSVSPGEYMLTTHLVGYIPVPDDTDKSPVSDLGRWSQTRLTVHPAEAITADVTLMRGASVAGRVLFPDGTPAISAAILALREEKPDKPGGTPKDSNFSTPASGNFTDDHGRFRVFGLPPGTYRIAANLRSNYSGSIHVLGSGDYTFAPALLFYSDGTYRRAKAKTYELKAGDEIGGAEIVIPLTDLHKVAGTAIAADGRVPNSGLLTLVDTSDSSILFSAGIKPGGLFAFAGVPSGTYKLTLTHVFIAKPDTSNEDYDPEGADIPVAAFSDASTGVIVSGDDILDLHFELKEIPLPPEKPDTP